MSARSWTLDARRFWDSGFWIGLLNQAIQRAVEFACRTVEKRGRGAEKKLEGRSMKYESLFKVRSYGVTERWRRVAPGDRGNRQSGKSTPLGILIPAFFWMDARRSYWRDALRAPGAGGHRHAATNALDAGLSSLYDFVIF